MNIDNVIMIGMPAAGKSTIGVLLAKRLGLAFTDTDIAIQIKERQSLHLIIVERGTAAFRKLEEAAILSLDLYGHVIATGGSVVYSEPAMTFLSKNGRIVFLDVPVEDLMQRLGDVDARGVVRAPGQTVTDLYNERLPLYRKWADITINCREKSMETIVKGILSKV